MISVSVETISPENLPSMRTVPSKSSLPSNWLPLPSSALRSPGPREAVGSGETLEGAGAGEVGAVLVTMLVIPFGEVSTKSRTSTRPGLFERQRRQHQQHQRLSRDEPGREWDVVHPLGLRAHLLP